MLNGLKKAPAGTQRADSATVVRRKLQRAAPGITLGLLSLLWFSGPLSGRVLYAVMLGLMGQLFLMFAWIVALHIIQSVGGTKGDGTADIFSETALAGMLLAVGVAVLGQNWVNVKEKTIVECVSVHSADWNGSRTQDLAGLVQWCADHYERPRNDYGDY
jgi:hypothetical protein